MVENVCVQGASERAKERKKEGHPDRKIKRESYSHTQQ